MLLVGVSRTTHPVGIVMAVIFTVLNVPDSFPLPAVWKSVTEPALLEARLPGVRVLVYSVPSMCLQHTRADLCVGGLLV